MAGKSDGVVKENIEKPPQTPPEAGFL